MLSYSLCNAFSPQVIQVYLTEVYPTETRGLASGLIQSCGRVGGALASPVAVGLARVSLVTAVGLVATCLLPVEPMGKTLEDIQKESKRKQ